MRSGVALALLLVLGTAHARYLGRELGALSELHHGVRGRVFAVDARTLFIQDFHYDGEGPAAFFYVGSSKSPSASGGIRLRDERGGAGPLRRYRGEGVTLALPEGKTLRDVSWFSVWCDEYSVNFGDVSIPRDVEYPRPAKVGALRGVHGVSSDPVVVVDAQTLLVPNFSYDGEAPDAKFWVGRGDKPSPQGIRIPDENGKEAPLRKYDKKTIVLTLPGELTVFDIGHFGVWCEAFTVNFGHVALPRAALANVPPSLKMLGVSPQSRNKALSSGQQQTPRRKVALTRLDATTYRPPSRLGAGPLAALLDTPADHEALLQRRADNYTPSTQQLFTDINPVRIQPSKEVFYLKQDVSSEYQLQNSQNQQLQNQNQQRSNYQQLHNHQQQQDAQQQYQNGQLAQLQTNYHQLQNQFQPHEQLYQRQLYEQQRQYEQQLLNEQYRQIQYQQQQGPVQYRLLPYQNVEFSQGQGRRHREASGVTIQRSVDLDLDAGSRE